MPPIISRVGGAILFLRKERGKRVMKRIISFLLALSMTVQLSMMAGAEVVSSDIDDSVAQSSIQEDKEVVNDSPVDVVLDDSKSVEENGDETQSRQDDESEKENVQLPAEKLLTNVEENPEPQEENVVVCKQNLFLSIR